MASRAVENNLELSQTAKDNKNKISEEKSKGVFSYLQTFEEAISFCLTFLFILKSWVDNDDKCDEASNYLLNTAEGLDGIQSGVDVTKATSGGVGIASGIAGVIGFGLLFNPITAFPGIVLLAISGGTGGLTAVSELSAKAHSWRMGRKYHGNVRKGVDDLAKIDYDKISEIAKIFETITDKISKKFDIDLETARLHLMSFCYKMLSYVEVCRQAYNGDNVDLEMVKPSGKLCEKAKKILRAGSSVKNMPGACASFYGLISEAVRAAKVSSMVNAASAKDMANVARAATGTVDATGDAASVTASTFASLGKAGQVFASIGVALSILSIGLGGYTIYGAVRNIQANEQSGKSFSEEGMRMRVNALMIKMGIQLRAEMQNMEKNST